MAAKFGTYKGRTELNPGQMRFREKGVFATEELARAEQRRQKALGNKTKVVHYPGAMYPWALYAMAKHDFWKKDFIVKR